LSTISVSPQQASVRLDSPIPETAPASWLALAQSQNVPCVPSLNNLQFCWDALNLESPTKLLHYSLHSRGPRPGRPWQRFGLFSRPGRSERDGHQDPRPRVVPGRSSRRPLSSSRGAATAPRAQPRRARSTCCGRTSTSKRRFSPPGRLADGGAPAGRSYPVLAIQGEQGAAKSTLARILRLLIDPQSCPLLLPPKCTRDLMATAVNGWLLAYDNISAIPA